jgi:hypothetical protein
VKLSDIIGGMDVSTFPQIAFVIFLVAFCAIGWRVLRPNAEQRAALDAAANLPMEDDTKGAKP